MDVELPRLLYRVRVKELSLDEDIQKKLFSHKIRYLKDLAELEERDLWFVELGGKRNYNKINKALQKYINDYNNRKYIEYLPLLEALNVPKELYDLPMTVLNILSAIPFRLKNYNILKIGDLNQYSSESMLNLYRFGVGKVQMIKDALEDLKQRYFNGELTQVIEYVKNKKLEEEKEINEQTKNDNMVKKLAELTKCWNENIEKIVDAIIAESNKNKSED